MHSSSDFRLAMCHLSVACSTGRLSPFEVAVEDIPNIKKILMNVSQTQYLRMHRRLKQVQRHFVINGPPKRFDIFHMTLHSIWPRRSNIQIQNRSATLSMIITWGNFHLKIQFANRATFIVSNS